MLYFCIVVTQQSFHQSSTVESCYSDNTISSSSQKELLTEISITRVSTQNFFTNHKSQDSNLSNQNHQASRKTSPTPKKSSSLQLKTSQFYIDAGAAMKIIYYESVDICHVTFQNKLFIYLFIYWVKTSVKPMFLSFFIFFLELATVVTLKDL